MTSRERMMTALRHEQPDRPPIDLGGVVTGIHRDAYNNLKAALGIDEPTVISDFKQQLAEPSEAVLSSLGVDTRYVSDGSRAGHDVIKTETADSFGYVDAYGLEWRMPRALPLYYDMVNHPLAGLTAEDLDHYDWPEPSDAGVDVLAERARDLYENTDYALVIFGPASFFEFAWYLRGFENYMMDMMLDEAFMNKLLDKLLEQHLSYWEPRIEAVGKYVQVVQVADDLGHQAGPMMSLDMFNKYIRPRHKEVIDFIRARTDAKVFQHSCGAIAQFIPALAENGIDIINPVQTSAVGMEPEYLKAEFGERVCFWGGIDSQHLLPNGSPEDVAAETRRIIGILGEGGGYIVNPVHNIQADVPAENIIALFEAAREYLR